MQYKRVVNFNLSAVCDFNGGVKLACLKSSFAKHNMKVSYEELVKGIGMGEMEQIESILKNRLWIKQWKHHVYFRNQKLQKENIEAMSIFHPRLQCMVNLCKFNNLKVSVTSEYSSDITNEILSKMKTKGIEFDFNICAEEKARGDPSPYMLATVMEKLGITRSEDVITIGNNIQQITSGNSIGAYTIALTEGSPYSYTDKTMLNDCEDAVSETTRLLKTIKPDNLIHSLSDLPQILVNFDEDMFY